MNGEELKEAFLSKRAVKFTVDSMPGITIDAERIDAIIYRYIQGKLAVSAELLDKNKHTVYIVPARCVVAV